MDEFNKQLLKEGLILADDALARIMEIDDDRAKHLANMLHAVIFFGESIQENE